MIKLESAACNLCSSDRKNLLFQARDYWLNGEETYGVVKCADCGLVYLDPRPPFEEMRKLYPEDFYNPSDNIKPGYEQDGGINAAKAEYISAKPPGVLFEIGAYWGGFLEYMRRKGWDVKGCEASLHPKDIYDIGLVRGNVWDANLPDQSVDVVAAWAVLEHTHEPLRVARECSRILKKGGQFVFLVPNFDSLSCRWMKKDDFPRHLYFFTPSSIAKLAEQSGFILEKIWFNGDIFQLGALGLIEYSFRSATGIGFERYMREKRSREFLAMRANMSLYDKLRHDGALVTAVRAADRIAAPIVDKISMLSGRYGIMTARLLKK